MLHGIETQHGRERAEHWGDRTLDLDLVDYAGLRSGDGAALTLPHPRAHERDFVLRPWLEVDPDAVLPGAGRVADLVAALDVAGHPEVTGHDAHHARPAHRHRRHRTRSSASWCRSGLAAMNMPKLRPEFSLAITLVLVARRCDRARRAGATGDARQPAHRVDPFCATRVVVLAKAAALGGALIAGVGLGLVLELALRSGEPGADAYLRVLSVLGGRHRACSPAGSSPSSSARCRRRRRRPRRGPADRGRRVALMP